MVYYGNSTNSIPMSPTAALELYRWAMYPARECRVQPGYEPVLTPMSDFLGELCLHIECIDRCQLGGFASSHISAAQSGKKQESYIDALVHVPLMVTPL